MGLKPGKAHNLTDFVMPAKPPNVHELLGLEPACSWWNFFTLETSIYSSSLSRRALARTYVARPLGLMTMTRFRYDLPGVKSSHWYRHLRVDRVLVVSGDVAGEKGNQASIAGSKPRVSKLQKKLTARESEVLFLLLFGRKPQYITDVKYLNQDRRRPCRVIEAKFGARSKSQLIEFALDSGLGSVIPETLLKKQISVVLHGDWL